MSTRSGKRIHSSFHEDTAITEIEPAVKSERKTRSSKRQKENVSDHTVSFFKSNKRNNYVSYPTDDLNIGEGEINNEDEEKKSRVLRRNTLKEQNIVSEDNEAPTDTKNFIRKSRRGKKNAENVSDDAQEIETHDAGHNAGMQKQKSKKNKYKKMHKDNIHEESVSVPEKKAKKKKKKGKRPNSMIVEEIIREGHKSNVSVDSFHSAAGSPVNLSSVQASENIDTSIEKDNINSTVPSKRKHRNKGTTNKPRILPDTDKNSNDSIVKDSKKRQSIQHDTIFDKSASVTNTIKDIEIDMDSVTSESCNDTEKYKPNKDDTFEKPTKNFDTAFEKDMVEDKKDSTFDKIHTNILNTTFEKDDCSTPNKRKKSSVNDNTFDKNKVDDTTFEKDTDVTPVGSVKKNAKRKSTKNATFDKSNISEDDFTVNSTNKAVMKKISSLKDATCDKSCKNDIIVDSAKKSLILRRSSVINATFDKSNMSEVDINVSSPKNAAKTRKSNPKDTTFDKNNIFEHDVVTNSAKKTLISRKSSLKDATFDKSNISNDDIVFVSEKINVTARKSSLRNATFAKSNISEDDMVVVAEKHGAISRKSSIKDATFDKIIQNLSDDIDRDISNSAEPTSPRLIDSHRNETISKISKSTFDNDIKGNTRTSLNWQSKLSFEKSTKLNTTYENDRSKSSVISSDNSEMDKSNISRISITSDDSSENIVNTTPVLIESSVDESHISKKESPLPQTPLKREGTFTKEGPEVPQDVESPSKRKSLPVIPSAGCTPYHVTKSSQKRMLNVTRSIEKDRVSVEASTKTTKVMFCSPVDNPALVVLEKKKIIKSNLKGSNKSFVFEDSVCASSVRPPARKRSYTQNDADDSRAKRKRLASELQHSVDRLSRPRTSSAAAKLTESTTPSKKPVTPSKSKTEAKAGRTKLPNFAALHQRQFAKMESLGECQERKAKRAKQLLTPTGAINMLERISPKGTTESPKLKEPAKKTDTPTKLPTLESLRPGFTRFGFKLNLDVNPFSVPAKNAEPKPNGTLTRQGTLPSLAGATSVRKEVAKQAVMREKSFTDKRNLQKRNENRTIIKGVRTNRRFELQMKMRNVE